MRVSASNCFLSAGLKLQRPLEQMRHVQQSTRTDSSHSRDNLTHTQCEQGSRKGDLGRYIEPLSVCEHSLHSFVSHSLFSLPPERLRRPRPARRCVLHIWYSELFSTLNSPWPMAMLWLRASRIWASWCSKYCCQNLRSCSSSSPKP
jgi:hypothetical protein